MKIIPLSQSLCLCLSLLMILSLSLSLFLYVSMYPCVYIHMHRNSLIWTYRVQDISSIALSLLLLTFLSPIYLFLSVQFASPYFSSLSDCFHPLYFSFSLQYMVREHLVEQGSTYQKKGGQGLIRESIPSALFNMFLLIC